MTFIDPLNEKELEQIKYAYGRSKYDIELFIQQVGILFYNVNKINFIPLFYNTIDNDLFVYLTGRYELYYRQPGFLKLKNYIS